MAKTEKTRKGAAPPKEPVRARGVAAHRIRRSDQSWFVHPEVQAGIAEAEADVRAGRTYRTDSPEAAQELLDRWKR